MIETAIVKDELYYSDMTYALKKRFGMIKPRDVNTVTERRVMDRLHSVSFNNGEVVSDTFSPFALEMFSVVDEMRQRAGIVSKGFRELSKHLDAVSEVLGELESRDIRTFQKK